MPECKVKRALISVSDKSGVVEFAKGLSALGVEIVSTGGTYKTLVEAGISALRVSAVTGFPEILDGRVKTLHPAVHGSILARRDVPEHRSVLAEHGIVPTDLVAVNLYPFQQTASRPNHSWEDLIENIDIGGPSMVRSAAKNHEHVLVIVHPDDYEKILRQLRERGDCPRDERVRLALSAFRHTAEYDACIFETLAQEASKARNASDYGKNKKAEEKNTLPSRKRFELEKMADLRYGENPGQSAALYRGVGKTDEKTFIDAIQLQGKELSWNNWLDADSAFKVVQEFAGDVPVAVVIKHTNPCGAAAAPTIEEAFERAYAADSVSAFGGIVAVNRPVTAPLARSLLTFFQEVVVAPTYTDEARAILKPKTNLRLLELVEEAWKITGIWEWKSIQGGFLVQERDLQPDAPEQWKVVTVKSPSAAELQDMDFAMKIAKHVKSNAIVLAKNQTTVGVGAGQSNRVGAAEIAFSQAQDKAFGSVLASDAFFPFSDTVRLAAQHGISAIIQPGGSLKDQESIDAADELGIAMIHTGVRHFKH